MPRLVLRVALRAAALQVERDREQPVLPPLRHRGDELARVAVGVPLLRVGIGPLPDGLRVQVVEGRLHHPAVQQQAFDLLAFQVRPSYVGSPLMRNASPLIATVVLRVGAAADSAADAASASERERDVAKTARIAINPGTRTRWRSGTAGQYCVSAFASSSLCFSFSRLDERHVRLHLIGSRHAAGRQADRARHLRRQVVRRFLLQAASRTPPPARWRTRR